MRRRDLIAAIGGVALLRPLSGPAQPRTIPVIGILVAGRPSPDVPIRLFREGLRDLGYIEGQNIRIEIRSAEGNDDRLPALAAELVRQKVDVIVPWQTPAAKAAKQASNEIPIVLLSTADPVRSGLIASLARPGGNVTGTAALIGELAGKNLELLKELIPTMRRAGALTLAGNPFSIDFVKESQDLGKRLGVEVEPELALPDDLEKAFAVLIAKQVEAVVMLPNLPMEPAATLALRNHLPTAAPWRPFAEAGGLLAYTFDQAAHFRQAASLVDKILKGARPADLPVEQPAKFELVINLKTAKTLGLTVPQSLLQRADEVIE